MIKYLLSLLLCSATLAGHAQGQGVTAEDAQTTEMQDEAQKVQYGLRTNALSWITLTPHVEFDFFMNRHWNVSVGGAYGWWGFNGDQHALQSWKVVAETRYYLKAEKFTGHALGARIEGGQFDFRPKDTGRRGKYATAGLTYSYTLSLGKRHLWYMDAGLGGGLLHADYTKYEPYKPTQCYHKICDKKENKLGLTNVFINIGYRFPVKSEKGGAR